MIRRFLQTMTSFVGVLIIYALYQFLLVPLIVPDAPIEAPRIDFVEFSETPPQIKRLKEYFSEDAWESQQPIVIEKPEFALLLQNYEGTADDQLKIRPCTFVFFPEGRPSSEQEKPVVILRAPGGAILDFEGGCDLARAKIGQLQGGRLLGEVSIRSHDPQNDPEKYFSLKTRDVELREDRLWSRNDVTFQFGQNRGAGRGLQMQFRLQNDTAVAENDSTIQTLERIELLRDVQLFLNLKAKPLLPNDPFVRSDTSSANRQPTTTPVEVRCQGRFRWDGTKMLATFEDQVRVTRHHTDGSPDQLTCDTLAIRFADQIAPTSKKIDPSPASLNLQPTHLIADGNPVSVSTPTWQASAQGNHLEVDLKTQRLILRGDTPVTLAHQQSALTAIDIDYLPGKQGELGTLRATGPGRLISAGGNGKQASFEASWKRILEMKPHEKGQVISIMGGGRIQHAESSALQAEKIWLWLDKLPAERQPKQVTGSDRTAWGNWVPHSALAVEKVRMNGEKLSAVSDRLEVWFEQKVEPVQGTIETSPAKDPLLGSAFSPQSKQEGNGPQAGDFSGSHYHIRGDLIQLTLAMSGQGRPIPTAASVSGQVELTEKGTDQPPLSVHGDHLDLFDADTPQAVVSLTGQPARATGRSASITGATLQLERGTGKMWVRGAGAMQVPLDRDLQGKPLEKIEILDITWKGEMHFDSQTIAFDRNVVAKTENQQLHTSNLKITLNRQLNFEGPIKQDTLEIKNIACLGGVRLTNRDLEGTREIALDRLTTEDLKIEQPSGRLTARGPGVLTSVRNGASSPSPLLLTTSPTATTTKTDSKKQTGISYLRVDFLKGLAGNVHHRELTFLEKVLCTYGPVKHRQEEVFIDPAIGPRGDQVILQCDRLTVRQMGSKKPAPRPVEMEAEGNSQVNGDSFSASGHRLTYTTGKELLVLEGAGETYAQLSRHTGGVPPSNLTAQKIYFWRAENRVQMDGIRLFNGNLPPPSKE